MTLKIQNSKKQQTRIPEMRATSKIDSLLHVVRSDNCHPVNPPIKRKMEISLGDNPDIKEKPSKFESPIPSNTSPNNAVMMIHRQPNQKQF